MTPTQIQEEVLRRAVIRDTGKVITLPKDRKRPPPSLREYAAEFGKVLPFHSPIQWKQRANL